MQNLHCHPGHLVPQVLSGCCSVFSQAASLVGRTRKGILFSSAFGPWPCQGARAAQAGWVSTGSPSERRGKKQGTMAFCSCLEVMDTAPGTCTCAVLQYYYYVTDSALELVFFNIIWFGFFFFKDWINYLNKRNKLILLLSAILRIFLPWSQRLDLVLKSDIRWIKIYQTNSNFLFVLHGLSGITSTSPFVFPPLSFSGSIFCRYLICSRQLYCVNCKSISKNDSVLFFDMEIRSLMFLWYVLPLLPVDVAIWKCLCRISQTLSKFTPVIRQEYSKSSGPYSEYYLWL